MAKKMGLGKGLGAIFGEDVVEARHESQDAEVADKGTEKGRQRSTQRNSEKSTEDRPTVRKRTIVQKSETAGKSDKKQDQKDKTAEIQEVRLKLSVIEPNQEQPRKEFKEESIQELADSMKKYGVLQPLLVQKKGERYEIIAGERRWRAAKEAGLKEVPVIIREYTKQQTMEIALIENVQREDLNPIEEAMAYQQLMEEFHLTQEEIASRVSKNRATITNSMRLLKLDKRVQDMLIQGQISSGHARALLSLEQGEQQYQIGLKIIAEKLSVRDVEKLVKALVKPRKEKKKEDEERDISFVYHDLEERMKQIMGTKVSINRKDRNKGRIEIEYYSEAELERLIELIESIR